MTPLNTKARSLHL